MSGTARPTREQYLLRNRVADELLRRVERTGDPTLPWAAVPEMAAAFGDETAVLTHLAARWSRNLAGSLDPVLDLPDADRERAAADVAAALAARRPGLHAVLHQHSDHPAVRTARETDRARAGLVHAPVQAGHVAPRWGVVRALRGLAGREWEWVCTGVSRTRSSLRRAA
ncbi:MAG: hypothetical protein L0I76_23445 [Pseudonocardia sp.]|nr:hypothetical protein [Pseudonocardia sp.]